jgi:hypothetical protein
MEAKAHEHEIQSWRSRPIEVVHILDARHGVVHPCTSAARIVEDRLSYAG